MAEVEQNATRNRCTMPRCKIESKEQTNGTARDAADDKDAANSFYNLKLAG
jgi:hypothetical protein